MSSPLPSAVASSALETSFGSDENDSPLHDPESEPNRVVVKEGMLWKQGPPPWRSWKKRFVVLTENNIEYYKPTKNKPKASLKGNIHMGSQVLGDAEILPKSQTKRNFCFKINTQQRMYFFSADTSDLINEWILSINKVILNQARKNQPAEPQVVVVEGGKRKTRRGGGSEEKKKDGLGKEKEKGSSPVGERKGGGGKGSEKEKEKEKEKERKRVEKEEKKRKGSENNKSGKDKPFHIPTDDEIKKMSVGEVKELEKRLDKQEEEEVAKCRERWREEKLKAVDELIKKEIAEVVDKYEQERTEILNAIKEKGGGVPPASRVSKKSTFNRQSLRRAYYGKKDK